MAKTITFYCPKCKSTKLAPNPKKKPTYEKDIRMKTSYFVCQDCGEPVTWVF